MYINTSYNHINICVNAVTILREDFLPAYQSIKRHSEFAEYFIPDLYHPSYSWNIHIYTSLGHSQLFIMTNYTCVKYSVSTQVYKNISTHSHQISVWTVLSRLIHSRDPHLGGINGGVQSDLSTPVFKNGEQIEDFHSIILRIQQ